MDAPLRIAVCYPWSVPFIDTRFTETALNLQRPAGCEVRFFRGYGWCSARRHIHACERARAWNADLILIFGADQTYPEDTLVKLLNVWRSTGGQCAMALVPMRGFSEKQGDRPFQCVGWRLKPEITDSIKSRTKWGIEDFEPIDPEKHGDLVQVHAAGTGCIMFPADALDRVPQPWFAEYPDYPGFERKACADTPFITRLQTHAGLSIWCDTTIDVKHCHTFEIDRTFVDRFADWAEGGGDESICGYKKGNGAPSTTGA